ncbi:G-protein coupled receptor Mth2 [Holothuria leucospilota]|uniref:G-protein coupled receptor Mth2 n=1 Tax=Holothuria leucospilota TaxID=206669 RepID=A0A9Q1BIB6_HOLLE|nr:G-protein coupled receptor Mth2 [Holothuria leucospilota]
MMTEHILILLISSVALITGFTEMTTLQQSNSPGFGSDNYFQSCREVVRNCKCDRLCLFYGDCCKDFKSDGQSTILYNQNNGFLNFDDFECRLIPGYDKTDNLWSNCNEKISYWIISRCPRTASKTLKTQCEREYDLDELVEVRYIRPVNDAFGNVYKNYYCAMCHNIPPDEIMVWFMKEVCNDCPEELSLSQNHFINLANRECHVSVTKPTIDTHEGFNIRLRSCYKDMVRSCPLGSNSSDSIKCSEFSSPGYFRGVYFKNMFCGRCHGMENSRNWSQEVLDMCSLVLREPEFTVLSAISFSDSLCSLIRCSRPLNLCSGTGRSSIQYLTLTFNDNFRCSHLTERGELCFFEESQLKDPMLPWKKMIGTNPLWSKDKNESHSVTIYQLPQNITANWKTRFDNDILKTARHLIQLTENSCYLKNMEVVEVCSAQEWEILGECNGDVVEVDGDEILERENIFLNELSFNLSSSVLPSWYSVHTRFLLDFRSTVNRRTLVCFVNPEIQGGTMWQRVFAGLCIAITICFHLATFVTYATFRPLRNTFGISLMCFVMSLAIALCLLEFVADYIKGIEYLCQIIAIGSHYFWLSSFCWVTVLAWDLHVTLSPTKLRVRQASSLKRLVAYCCFGWGLPCFIVAVCVTLWVIDIPQFSVTYGSVQGTLCWIHDHLIRLIAVAGPLVFCIFTNICLSLMIWRSLYNYKKDSRVTQNDLHNPKRRMLELVVYVKVSMLMGFSWIFGFLADFTKVEALRWFFYLSFLIQACLIFVFFGLSGKVRNMWKSSAAALSSTKSTTIN